MSLKFQENLPKVKKIPYHQVMEQLPCTGIPNFEQVIIHSRNNVVVILVPSYHGYFRLHEFVFFCTSVTILKTVKQVKDVFYILISQFLYQNTKKLLSCVNNQTTEVKN